MAVTVKKGSTTVRMADLLATYKKDYGDEIGSFGGKKPNPHRLSTGLFELDLALAGGFPRGKVTMIYGPESSNKSVIAMLALAQHQRDYPDLICGLVDIEQSFDPAWAKALGVDVKKLVVLRPDYAEQAVDMVEGLLYAEDCGLVVVDSLAAMVTANELDSSAEKAVVGGAAAVIAKMVRKTTTALGQAEKRGHYPTLIYINQIMFKVGVVFGNPETYPGGTKVKHQCSCILRVYGKNIVDPKISAAMPVIKEVKFVVAKHKMPILSVEGQFSAAMLPHKGLKPGQCDDSGTIFNYLKGFDMFGKAPNGKGWIIVGDHYEKQADFETKLFQDPVFGAEIRSAIVHRVMKESTLLLESEDD